MVLAEVLLQVDNRYLSASFIFHDWPLLIIAAALAVLAHWIIYRVSKKIVFSQVESESLRYAYRKLRFPTMAALIFIAVTFAYNTLEIRDELVVVLNHISSILIIVTIAWALISLVRILRVLTMRKYDVSAADNLVARTKLTRYKVLERIAVAIIIVFATGSILMTFEAIRSIGTSLLASAGVAGIVLGFAAQRSIATFLAGIQIAITQPIRLEDAVVVEGEWGWIEEITFTYVVIRIWDRRRLVVPINYFIEQPFQNWTRNSADILGTVYIRTDFQVPINAIRDELDRLLEGNKLWNKEVKVVQVTDSDEKTMEVRILVSAENSPTAWDLRVFLREKMLDFLGREYPASLPRTRVMLENNQKEDLFTNQKLNLNSKGHGNGQQERKSQA